MRDIGWRERYRVEGEREGWERERVGVEIGWSRGLG